MVRRRTRATAAPKNTVNGVVLENGSTVALTNAQLLEDQYFASPKRKDCKIEENSSSNDGIINGAIEDDVSSVKPKIKSSSPNKIKGERGALNGKTIGVPLATRSQTRTIENFFKANAAAKQHSKSNKYSPEPQKIIQPTLSASVTPPQMVNFNATNITQDQTNGHDCIHDHNIDQERLFQQQKQLLIHQQMQLQQHHNQIITRRSLDNIVVPQEFIFDLSEDTNDSERTDISEEPVADHVQENVLMTNGIDFTTHRSSQRADSHSSSHSSSNTSATENIFLQEPVLTLNVDKSPNQASSIKINKTLEVDPKFSSPTSLTASVLHGRFNQIVSLNSSPSKRDSFGYEKKPIEMLNGHDYALMMLPENDNSSCDSGVALTSNAATSLEDSVQATPAPGAGQTSRRRKPATPHRIVCCSPIKAAPRVVSPVGSPSTRKMTSTLSPRKSQRHLTTTTVAAATAGGGVVTTTAASKTRRRLNPSPTHATKEHQQHYLEPQTQSNQDEKHYVHDHDNDDDPVVVLINDDEEEEDIDEHDQECENMVTNVPALDNKNNQNHLLNGVSKSILNSAKHPTNQQNATNNRGGKQKSHQSKTKYTVQRSQHAPLKHQAPQPLAATNGNREINDFFPVRRSVRKTKTAVKEEMMRNLEQAILEERSEGLKIAHFEGKGRGIIAERRFQRGEFVIEYVGDLISTTEAAEREKRYALDENAGCYMYYFKHKNQQYCIDATEDTGKLGRLVNHSRNGNLMTKVVVVKQKPHLVLIAKDDIVPGEELCYDYGDRSKESLLHHPWLAF
ncbi:SET domain containing 8 isoform 1-T4 [Cochliomyia hominivorax]